ncbi:hypothetical protein D3C87_1025380 [compost metagenome]|jgi:hypothetical protein
MVLVILTGFQNLLGIYFTQSKSFFNCDVILIPNRFWKPVRILKSNSYIFLNLTAPPPAPPNFNCNLSEAFTVFLEIATASGLCV